MFTGIISELGEVFKIEKKGNSKIFDIKTANILANKQIGQSIAVNGVCVTVTGINKNNFTFEAVEETLNKSNLSELNAKDKVNLEPALQASQSLDGHIVQGHIDATGKVKSVAKQEQQTLITIEHPPKIAKYLALKGSITVNGVSLTISQLGEADFAVTLIPHTLKNTNLGLLKPEDQVNLEVDIIARYLERLISTNTLK